MHQTRESCIECVEKHLGAALILLTETRDGYKHRLRAIGHLHEAEDESQAWPLLHDTIRVMRKDFQHEGRLPDFELLQQLTRQAAASPPQSVALGAPQSGLDLAALQRLAASVGFPNPNLAAAVAMAESGGNPSVVGDLDYGGSVGLWQINLPSSPQYDAESLKDPVYNAKAALAISRNGTNWNPWTTFRTGAYERFYAGPGGPRMTSPAVKAALVVVGGLAALTAAFYVAHGRLPNRRDIGI